MSEPIPEPREPEEFTGILPRRFRRWAFGVLGAAGLVVGFYSLADPEEIAVWAGLIGLVLGLGSGVASFNTRGTVTRD